VGQRLLGGVGERECDVVRAEFGRDSCGLAVKLKGRTLPFRAHHFDIAPADAVTPSRAQSLHRGFFGSKARGIAFKAAGFLFAVTDFTVGEDAPKKSVAKSLDASADARNFSDVNPGAENNKDIVKR